MKQILLGVQDLLTTPNINSAANQKAYDVFKRSSAEYSKLIREQAKRFTPTDF
jgi:ubiquitin-conjugating enzyme E2 I